MSRRARRALLGLAVALAMTVLPGTAFGAAKGIETEITWGVSSAVQNQDVAAMRDLGVGWTRLTLSWHDAEPSKGSFNSKYLTGFDSALSLARGTGAHVIVAVYESPQWASGSTDTQAPPQNPQDYADFMSAMASRYAGQVSGWEIWNEENLGRYWGGSVNPAAYGNMLKLTYPAVKSADPAAQVIFGGMSENDWDYLQSVYRDVPDIGSNYDVMAVHPYSAIWSPDEVRYDSGGHITMDSFAGYREVRRVMLEHGTDKPMYFTEMGWSTTTLTNLGVSPQQQADYTTLAWKCMQQDSYVQVGFLYELRNNFWMLDANTWEDQLGLVTSDWTHKPAYDAFRAIDPNQGGCTYHESSGTPAATPGTQPAGAPTAPAEGARTGASSSSSSSSSSSASTTRDSAPRIVLKVKTAGAQSAGASKNLKTGRKFKVFGKVVGAKGGRLTLAFERRVHGKWRNAFRNVLIVQGDGSFTSVVLNALSKGGWRVQGHYTAAKSRYVYFKA
ncbi:MAG: cellulase family glycosylhydrolase [Gaiellaceae bacterium]